MKKFNQAGNEITLLNDKETVFTKIYRIAFPWSPWNIVIAENEQEALDILADEAIKWELNEFFLNSQQAYELVAAGREVTTAGNENYPIDTRDGFFIDELTRGELYEEIKKELAGEALGDLKKKLDNTLFHWDREGEDQTESDKRDLELTIASLSMDSVKIAGSLFTLNFIMRNTHYSDLSEWIDEAIRELPNAVKEGK